MAKKVAVAPAPVVKKEPLSAEATRLINELWDQLELTWGRAPSYQELQEQIAVDYQTMDEFEYHLRQLVLKVRSSYRKSGEKPAAEYRDVDPE